MWCNFRTLFFMCTLNTIDWTFDERSYNVSICCTVVFTPIRSYIPGWVTLLLASTCWDYSYYGLKPSRVGIKHWLHENSRVQRRLVIRRYEQLYGYRSWRFWRYSLGTQGLAVKLKRQGVVISYGATFGIVALSEISFAFKEQEASGGRQEDPTNRS